jgi:hypothetical protein
VPFSRQRVSFLRRSFALAVLALPLPAGAAPSAVDRTMAQSLFDDARRLMTAGDYAAACPKLEESNRLEPSGGTLLNLALCREQEGKLATAWTHFKQALSAGKRDDRPDRVQAAEEHLKALELRVPSLTVVVAEPRAEQEVWVDGAALGRGAWGTRMLLDPGKHEVSSRTPGTPTWSQSLALEPGSNVRVEVPPLAAGTSDAAPVAAKSEDKPSEAAASGGGSTAGWVIAGAGVVALGVGSVFGVQALSKQQKSDEECPTSKTCSPAGVEYGNQANTAAWIANIGIGVGLVGLATGTFLILSSSKGSAQQARSNAPVLRVGAGPGSGRITLEGLW